MSLCYFFLCTIKRYTRSVLLSIEAELKVISDIAWKEKLNATSAIRGNAQGAGNKLKTYSEFKHEYGTGPYNNNNNNNIYLKSNIHWSSIDYKYIHMYNKIMLYT